MLGCRLAPLLQNVFFFRNNLIAVKACIIGEVTGMYAQLEELYYICDQT